MNQLSKRFGKIVACDNLSFTITPGQIYALIGPNGAGKTTAIKIIVGLYRMDSGRINLFNQDITIEETKARATIGYIPDEPVFYPYLTGKEFLEFVSILYKVPPKAYKKQLAELLTFYPIADILNDYPEHFSRGNKQKLSIIAALLHNPKLLVVDEPIVGLDPQSAKITARVFSGFAKKGGMILVSTHTLSFVEKLATKVGIIDRGRLIFEGKPKNLVSVFMSLTSHD